MLRMALNKEEHYCINDCIHILKNNFKIQSDLLKNNYTYINNHFKSKILLILQTMESKENYLHNTDSIINTIKEQSHNFLQKK